jgi:hypothetical protein
MLKKSEFVDYAPDNPGVIRINHATPYCHGDSKSLKIERKEDGSIHAKCFRCGQWGVHDSKVKSFTLTYDTNIVEEDDEVFEYDLDKWPGRALHWVKQYGISDFEIREYELAYSHARKRVILPIWWAGEKLGYQARKIYDEDTGPKYITKAKAPPGFMLKGEYDKAEIVLVEDVISAIKVGRACPTVAILSTNPTSTLMDYVKTFSNYKIWLDMDNPQVIRQALKLLKSLNVFGTTRLIVSPKDPKCYDDYDIRGWLYGS